MEEQNKNKPKENNNSAFDNSWIVALISLFITLPIFLILKKTIPSLNWPLYIDVILIFLILWGLISLLVKSFEKIMYGLLTLLFVALIYGSFFGNYGLASFFKDYKQLINEMKASSNPSKTLVYTLTPNDNKPFSNILDNISVNQDVKKKAQYMSTMFFADSHEKQTEKSIYYKSFSIYKSVKQEWVYIKDLLENDHLISYEIINDMSGDYDEFTTIVCSLIKAVGGKVSILYKNENEMHPLLLIGDQKDEADIRNMIKELFPESSRKQILFFPDTQGQSWVVLSFFHDYPGGRIMNKNEYQIVDVEK